LCNIALNGLENAIKENPAIKLEKTPKIKVVRYADDIVITGNNPMILDKCKLILEEFLMERGLELNQNKTRITQIKDGIDLLGFNIRRLP